MTQKPTVGRVVHYYGRDLDWHMNMADPHWDRHVPAWAKSFTGPFNATIVAVLPSGSVNLRVDYPTPLFGSERVAQIRENVGMGFDAHPCATTPGNWVWPPRTP